MSEEKTDIQPLWAGWNQPQKPSEALKLCESYARMEGLWCKNTLFTLRKIVEESPGDHEFDHGYSEHVQLLDKVEREGLTCGNISACAVGIVIMGVMDGPAVHRFFHPPPVNLNLSSKRRRFERSVEDQLTTHTVGGPTLLFLAMGMSRYVWELREKRMHEYPASYDDDDYTPIPKPENLLKAVTDVTIDKRTKDKDAALRRARVRQYIEARNTIIEFNDDGGGGFFHRKVGYSHHEAIIKSFEYGREFAEQFEDQLGF